MESLEGILKRRYGGGISEEDTPIISSTSSPTCPLCGGTGYLRRDVPVGHPDFGRLIACACRKEVLLERQRENLRRLGNLTGVLAGKTFASFVPEGFGLSPQERDNLRRAWELAREFAEEPSGWLILSGGYGCGKTHLAAAIANRCIERGELALLVFVPDILDHLRATFGPRSTASYDQRFEEVRRAALLILDDLGVENATPWAMEKLHQILNHRYNAQLPSVITTNLRLEEMPARLRSLLSDPDFCRYHVMLAPDFRTSGVEGYADLSSLSLLADKTFESFDLRDGELEGDSQANLRRAYEVACEYAEKPVGWLVFTGPFGSGKTHLAAAIANHRLNQGDRPLFLVVPDLLDYLRNAYSPEAGISYDQRLEQIRGAPLLILDDLGVENATPWAKEKLFQILNHRYNARLPTVITMSPAVEEADPRLRSRMLDLKLCTVFAILAPNYSGGLATRRAPYRSRRRS